MPLLLKSLLDYLFLFLYLSDTVSSLTIPSPLLQWCTLTQMNYFQFPKRAVFQVPSHTLAALPGTHFSPIPTPLAHFS